MPLPAWLTEFPTSETDSRCERPEKEDTFNDTEGDEAIEQQYVDYGRQNPLAIPVIRKDFRKCRDIDGFYNWAATFGIDVKKYSSLLFRRLYEDRKPLSLLLHVLEDTGMRTHRNFKSLLWQLVKTLRDDGERRQGRLSSDDKALMQHWISRQFYLGLMSERDIRTFLEFLNHVIYTTNKESSLCNLIASFDGLQSSPVLGFKDLQLVEQQKIVKLIKRGPVTRPLLEMGLRFIEVMPYPRFEGTDQRITSFIRSVLYAHTSGRKDGEPVLPSPDLVPTILETIWALPEDLKNSVILTTTKSLLSDSLPMKGVVPDLWLSALAKKVIRGNWSLKYRIEDFLGTQESAIAVPYLQQYDDQRQACFVLRHWFGYRSRPGHRRALRLFHKFLRAKRKGSSWVSMLQAAQKYARKSSQPSDTPIRKIFRLLQALDQSESIVEIVKQSRKLKSMIDDVDVVYIIREHLEQRPHLAERLFHFHPRLWLERCPKLAERMILDPSSHPANAQRYMRRYYPLFLANPERDRPGRYTRRRIQLLGRMALAYSSALHLPPGVAFKRVYQCYTQHMLEHLGPIPIAISRALTRTGLIRPLQSGQYVGTAKIRWILSVIWSIEGADVADRVEELVYKWREANWRPKHLRRPLYA